MPEAPLAADALRMGARAILPVLMALPFLTGCIYTSHHFNTGRILPPGQTAISLGYGNYASVAPQCPENGGGGTWSPDSTGKRCERYRPDSTGGSMETADPVISRSYMPKLSFGYRLGVREKWGPFTGVEIGWHLESYTNPASLEFDMKLGLPKVPWRELHHSISAGWIIGNWTDNSLFLEYAASRSYGKNTVYTNYRLTRLATQPVHVARDWGEFISRPRYVQQWGLGYHWQLPDILIVPDFITPQIMMTYPTVANGSDKIAFSESNNQLISDLPKAMEWHINVGFGWHFR